MKKKNLVILALLLGIVLLLNGCVSVSANATQGYAKTLEEAHPDRIEKTVVGMDINEFRKIWPEATRVGTDEIYEFVYTHLLLNGTLTDYRIYTRFYFLDSKLLKYESTQKISRNKD